MVGDERENFGADERVPAWLDSAFRSGAEGSLSVQSWKRLLWNPLFRKFIDCVF
jgi:hypothetical protein